MSRKYAPPLVKTSTQSGSRSSWWNDSTRMKPASTEPLNVCRLIKSLFKPLCCLLLNSLPRTRTARRNNGHASYFAEAPCFLAPLKLASLPLVSVASLRLTSTLSAHPPSSKLLHSRVQGLLGRMVAQERSQHPQNC